ncbi:hypothetical protein DY000_02055511 [Brassica cretica]|uniref:Uncharacterized protein n=1 Tax=Brassica cretica TaxID=69181 RepID=A0ABQ7A9E8_BRACR|nr:hypothetical protein DY000_02055511 [Brassica cretica]
MITVKYDAIDTSNLDHDEIGAECSVLNPTYSSWHRIHSKKEEPVPCSPINS